MGAPGGGGGGSVPPLHAAAAANRNRKPRSRAIARDVIATRSVRTARDRSRCLPNPWARSSASPWNRELTEESPAEQPRAREPRPEAPAGAIRCRPGRRRRRAPPSTCKSRISPSEPPVTVYELVASLFARIRKAAGLGGQELPLIARGIQRELDDAPAVGDGVALATELRGYRVAGRGCMHCIQAAATGADDELREAGSISHAVHVRLGEAHVLLVLRAQQDVRAGGIQHLGDVVHVGVPSKRARAARVQPALPRNRHEARLRVASEI